jgi:hypothetical protein
MPGIRTIFSLRKRGVIMATESRNSLYERLMPCVPFEGLTRLATPYTATAKKWRISKVTSREIADRIETGSAE